MADRIVREIYKTPTNFVVQSECVAAATITDGRGADFGEGDRRIIIDLFHDTKSTAWSWRIWIAWPPTGGTKAVLEKLDNAGICLACHKKILNVGVTPEGRVRIGH